MKSLVHLPAPMAMTCDLLRYPSSALLEGTTPRFGWQLRMECGMQAAYSIRVDASEAASEGAGGLWNSGRVVSAQSQNVRYGGLPLLPLHAYSWAVRVWNENGKVSAWSKPQHFNSGDSSVSLVPSRLNTTQAFQGKDMWSGRQMVGRTPIVPVRVETHGSVTFADFGRDAFGTLAILFPPDTLATPANLLVRLGEKLNGNGSIDRHPGGSINCREFALAVEPTTLRYELEISSRPKHLDSDAVQMPRCIGEVTPFRYAEIEGAPVPIKAEWLSQLAAGVPFDDAASAFHSSDTALDSVYDLCRHTMKATTFLGVYVDGERERRPYEADGFINQLSHYAVDAEYALARYSLEYLLEHPTWPVEWSFHAIMMAWADYEATGNTAFLEKHYEKLVGKLLLERARSEDGLLLAYGIVDWPMGERDGYNHGIQDPNDNRQIGPKVNTVVNAFFYHALRCMEKIASALGYAGKAASWSQKAAYVAFKFNQTFFDAASGLYFDGKDSDHLSLHASLFSLAFDLVPSAHQRKTAEWVASRGMQCSVYAAQYLLDALFENGQETAAFKLLTATDDRSWLHMMALGSTMTLEAWDARYKPNLTWNHPWGASPANIIARHILGVQPLEPGYKTVSIRPQPGPLTHVQGRVPTPRGPIFVAFRGGAVPHLQVEVPGNTRAAVDFGGTLSNVGPGRHFFKFQSPAKA